MIWQGEHYPDDDDLANTGRGEDPDYLKEDGRLGEQKNMNDYYLKEDERLGIAGPSGLMGTPGLPRPSRGPIPEVTMCYLCLTGTCNHRDHARGKKSRVPSLTFYEGTAVCAHCAEDLA